MRERASWPARDWEVRAILDGRKTQVRRVVKPQPSAELLADFAEIRAMRGSNRSDAQMLSDCISCPYGAPGDLLWLREAWQFFDWSEDGEPCIRYAADNAVAWPRIPTEHDAPRLIDIWAGLSAPENVAIDGLARDRRWRPSIHMPRWASRITLEIESVRVELLQDISSSDAISEGIEPCPRGGEWRNYLDSAPNRDALTPRVSFRSLWESINGPSSWDANPYVWAVSFRRITP